MQIGKQEYKVKHLTNVEDVIRWGEFLHEGWEAFRKPDKARCDIAFSDFMRQVFHIACGPPTFGFVAVYTSKNDKPLGFTVVLDDSEGWEKRTATILYAYSNGKYAAASTAAVEYIEKWARQRGFAALHTQGRRLNGAAMRFYRKKLGFQPVSIVFQKEL